MFIGCTIFLVMLVLILIKLFPSLKTALFKEEKVIQDLNNQHLHLIKKLEELQENYFREKKNKDHELEEIEHSIPTDITQDQKQEIKSNISYKNSVILNAKLKKYIIQYIQQQRNGENT